MTKKEHIQLQLDDLFIERLNYFEKLVNDLSDRIVIELNNKGGSNVSKLNGIKYISYKNNLTKKWIYLIDDNYRNELYKIQRTAPLYNKNAIVKWLLSKDYIKIDTKYNYFFIHKNELTKTIKKYNLCR